MHDIESQALLLVSVCALISYIFLHYTLSLLCRGELYWISPCSLVPLIQSELHSVAEPPAAQRDDSPMDVDQPSPLEQDQAALGEVLWNNRCHMMAWEHQSLEL